MEWKLTRETNCSTRNLFLYTFFAVKYNWTDRKKKRNIAANNLYWPSENKEYFRILRAQQLLYSDTSANEWLC